MKKEVLKNLTSKKKLVKSHQGGLVHKVDKLEFFKRFLFVGSESNYYQAGEKLTKKVYSGMDKLLKEGSGVDMVLLLTDVSSKGLAPSLEPTLCSLAYLMQKGDNKTKQAARENFNSIIRTGSHLMSLVDYLKMFGAISSSQKKTIASWYQSKTADNLAYQATKYRNRSGWTHKDILRQVHINPSRFENEESKNVLQWMVKGWEGELSEVPEMPALAKIWAYERAKDADASELVNLIKDYNLSWEMIPNTSLKDKSVLRQLAQNMPMTATIRYLNRFTIAGLTDEKEFNKMICERLRNKEQIEKARIHPLNVYVSLRTYQSGSGQNLSWTPDRKVVSALEDCMEESFKTLKPTGKKIALGLDVSASMGTRIDKVTAYEAEAFMSKGFVTAEGTKNVDTTMFSNTLKNYASSNYRKPVSDIVEDFRKQTFGGTYPQLVLKEATKNKAFYDAFVFYTDNEVGGPYNRSAGETWEAFEEYRKAVNPNAKMVVHAFALNRFSIGDPNDPGVLCIAGLDSSAPSLTQAFIAGEF